MTGWLAFLPLLGLALGLIVLLGTVGLWHGLRHPARFTYGTALARGLCVEPSELGLEAQEITLHDASGRTTRAWSIPSPFGSPPGSPPAQGKLPGGGIVMLHGFGRSRYSTLALAPLLAGHADRILLVDLPGHGDSAARGSMAGVTEWQDVLGFVEQVFGPDDPVVLYGRSYGAGIAIAAAAHAPGRFAGVIGEGAYRRPMVPIRRRLWHKRYPPEPWSFLVWLGLRLMEPELAHFDRARLAKKLTCPLLLLHGTEDQTCVIDAARQVARSAPRGDLVEIAGGGHLDLHTVDPAAWTGAIGRFFKQIGWPVPVNDKETRSCPPTP